ncbi:MAG: hypothetical protein PHW96_02040 [Candidatus Nanoarchaeia archaeon]|nr:hypothetical protein [Candidatus Nanoarchaeia archaeon]
MNVKINLKQLEKEKEQNLKDRMDFIDKHVEWIKKNPDKKWSKAQKDFLDCQYK